MRIFSRLLEGFLVFAALAAPMAPCGAAVVLLDAPGHAAPEGTAVTARGGAPGAPWRIVDWRGREVEGATGTFDERGEATLPPLPAGYYRMVDARSTPPVGSAATPLSEGGDNKGEAPLREGGDNKGEAPLREGGDPTGAGGSTPSSASTLATLAVVSPLVTRHASPVTVDCKGAFSAFAVDTASAWISRPGTFLCPWNDGDTERTVADLVRLCGFRHVRDRLKWQVAQPSPDAPPDFSRNLATAALFHERGAAVSGMFHDAPRWTRPTAKLPGDLGALHRFCAEAAAAFGDSVEDWEFWNEPDIHFAPEPVWEYAAVLKAAYLGFKSARPDLPVLNGALCQMPGKSRYFNLFFDNDTAHYFDIYNYHTYLPPAKYPEAFAKIRAQLADAGATNCPVWVTEFGTNLEGHSNREGAKKGLMAHSPEQELVHAEFYPKAQIALMMEGVERAYFFVFAAFNERNGRKDWGVIRRDGTVKPVFAAMATVLRELGDARLLGALATPKGMRAFLFERPDGTQTVAFWSKSPIDTVTSHWPVVEPEPDFAREWCLALPPEMPGSDRDKRDPPLRLIDMCGQVSTVPPSTNGVLALPATRFPSYLSGLRGLVASVSPHGRESALRPEGPLGPQSGHLGVVNAESVDNTIVLRVDLDRADFSIGSQKTLASLDADEGHLRIEVWNFSDVAKTGTVSISGCTLSGLPSEPFALPPFGHAEFDCVLTPGGETRSSHSSELRLAGNFNGRSTTQAVVPLFFAKRFLASCERVPLETADPSFWERNSSADEQTIAFDEAAGAIRFDAVWRDDLKDRWLYPIRSFVLPRESLVGGRRIVFEVKSEQDKVENDYRACKLMLASDDGKTDIYLDYDPPTREWEKRYVDIPPDTDLSTVTLLRIGANPLGSHCTIWIRNLDVLK